ncbi:riboflavin synthase [Desulfurobacterium atlanticum]|uniref:Riboflavin synthase n=1 Tax=Desulfurobacterium atlanticum TaxID=240169 RepID=A0A238XMF6_9BACT|nr:riboflavin synthase [Desulfurobacterium atlanticum]SNR59862.1 riboflavin synthase alpha chain [Desulfurobacterium atlanticum]
MFTGIVEETGKIKQILRQGKNSSLTVKCKKVIEETKKGDSIAVNGICLTVTEIERDSLSFDVSFETIEKSGFRYLRAGDIVNLERALKLSDRLGGHILQGHVDTITKITSIKRVGDSFLFSFKTPSKFGHLIVEKGSIGIDGISLTIASISESSFSVAVIPTTFEETNLKFKKPGDVVNIEFDIIGKYVEKMLKQMPK